MAWLKDRLTVFFINLMQSSCLKAIFGGLCSMEAAIRLRVCCNSSGNLEWPLHSMARFQEPSGGDGACYESDDIKRGLWNQAVSDRGIECTVNVGDVNVKVGNNLQLVFLVFIVFSCNLKAWKLASPRGWGIFTFNCVICPKTS